MPQPLKVTCPSCMAKFHIPLHLVRGKLVSFRCKKCKGAIPVDGRALTSATPQPLPAPSVVPPNTTDPRAPFYSEPPMRLSLSDGIVVHERLPSTAGLQADTPAAFAHSNPPLPRPVVPGASRTPSYGMAPALLASAPPPAVSRSDPPDALLRSDPPPSFRTRGRGKKVAGGVVLVAAAFLTLWGVGARVRTRAAHTTQAADHAKPTPPSNPLHAVTPEPARLSAPPPAMATEATPAIPIAALPTAKDTEPGSPKSSLAARARARALKAAQAAEAPVETAQAPEETSVAVPAAQPLTGSAAAAQEAITTVSQDIDFNKEAARHALDEAGQRATSCRTIDTPPGAARIAVTFAPSGSVTSATIDSGPFVGTPAGGCVASKFRTVHVPAFTGDPVTVHKSISF